MVTVRQERRRIVDGSLICENGVLRVWVIRVGSSLGLRYDICNDGVWTPLATTQPHVDLYLCDEHGEDHAALFFSYEPILLGGETCGVRLQGCLADMELSLTVNLSSEGTWCQHRLEFSGEGTRRCRELSHTWQIALPEEGDAFGWPLQMTYAPDLSGTPLAFVQSGVGFAALIPDMEDSDGQECWLRQHHGPDATLTYGIGVPTEDPCTIALPLRLSYILCVDGHAIPGYGYQQLVRLLGEHDALPMVGLPISMPIQGDMPDLPLIDASVAWRPFRFEHTPAYAVALTRYYLQRAVGGDLYALEEGLRWLDRLCLFQYLYEVPGGPAFGAVTTNTDTLLVAAWLPVMLLEAFRLTGLMEYALRARAALGALPAIEQGAVLGTITARHGDVLVLPDAELALAISNIHITRALFAPGCNILEVSAPRAFRLVIDGAEPAYAISVNGKRLDGVATERLREGVTIHQVRAR